MSDLDRDRQALIDRARRTEGPSPEDRARLRAKLEPVWAAYRAQQAGPSSDASAGPKGGLAGGSARGSVLNAVLLSALSLWGPEAAPEPPVPADHAPEAAAVGALAPGERAAEEPPAVGGDAVRERGVHDSARERAGVAVAAAEATQKPSSARALGSTRLGGRSVAAPVPLSAADAPARVDRQARSTARGERVPPVLLTDAKSSGPARAGQATGERAATEHADRAEPHARRGAHEVASVRATTLAPAEAHAPASARQAEGDRASPPEVGPVRQDSGFAPQPIDDELSWLASAQQALHEGRAERALRLVQEHAFRFPGGALAPERIAVQALALCALERRTAARAVLADLARAAPGSPLLSRVQRKCGDGS
jgi:hypothetical protein